MASAAHHTATIVVDLPIAKPDALTTVAFVADSEVEDAGTAHPRVWLGPQAWAQIEIPLFADPPPIAIDVVSLVSNEDAAEQARRLALALERVGWSVRPERPRPSAR